MHIAMFFLDDYTLGMEGISGIPIEGYESLRIVSDDICMFFKISKTSFMLLKI